MGKMKVKQIIDYDLALQKIKPDWNENKIL